MTDLSPMLRAKISLTLNSYSHKLASASCILALMDTSHPPQIFDAIQQE